MSQDNSEVTCTVLLEWLNANGSIYRKLSHRAATSRLIRDNMRQMFVEIRPAKANVTTKLLVKNIFIFNKFVNEGKASIKFQDERCTLFMSNAPCAPLKTFLETIFVKLTGNPEKNNMKTPLREQMFSNVSMGGAQEISPVTSMEINKAKEKAMAMSRGTITTPSPSAVKKRKHSNENNTPRVTVPKRLYVDGIKESITEEQTKILDAVLSGKNIFFTGSAGTGKSFLLKKIIAALPPDSTMATASTGVAACHIGGITLHQFAGIGLGTGTLERCYELASRSGVSAVWRRTKHLVIDEISMVEADFFDKLEAVARHVRRNDRPFGGIQLILCGDFFQLPPVSKNRDEKVRFCFQSEAWEKCVHFNFELQTVHRQNDPEFIKILNSLRIGRVTEEIANRLRATAKQKIEENGVLATRLCTHISEADETNIFKLNELKGQPKIYNSQDSDPSMTKILDQQLPVSSELVLKIGAQVMLLKNIKVSEGLVNGARGVITDFVNDMPVVRLRSGRSYTAQIETWKFKSANGNVVTRKQIPLKLAWAFSIHKSQGLTLECIEMCLSRVFDAGQSYVALSRAQSLQSLRIMDFNVDQVWANPIVLEFYKRFRRQIHEMEMIPLGRKKLKVS